MFIRWVPAGRQESHIFVTCSNCRRRNIICGGGHPQSDQDVAVWVYRGGELSQVRKWGALNEMFDSIVVKVMDWRPRGPGSSPTRQQEFYLFREHLGLTQTWEEGLPLYPSDGCWSWWAFSGPHWWSLFGAVSLPWTLVTAVTAGQDSDQLLSAVWPLTMLIFKALTIYLNALHFHCWPLTTHLRKYTEECVATLPLPYTGSQCTVAAVTIESMGVRPPVI